MAGYSHNANCITPVMTSNTTPSPWVLTASGTYADNAFRAFNQNCSDTNQWSNFDSLPQWIQVYCGGTIYCVTSYTITAIWWASNTSAPKNWNLKGSVDGANWTTIDTQTNQIAWGVNEMRTFAVANPDNYKYYQLYVTSVVSPGQISIYEIELIGAIAAINNPLFTFA